MTPPLDLAQSIRNKALELGCDGCGIIPVSEMKEYGAKLRERIERFPESSPMYSRFFGYAELEQKYPWAKSIVVATWWQGRYRIPAHLDGVIGKDYLTDKRRDTAAPQHINALRFDEYLQGLGLRTATEYNYGLTGLRWAAAKAGLGIIRKNNFFYTERGSCVHIDAWLIDQELELRHGAKIKPCPEHCGKCANACPTGALAGPYLINGVRCVSYLTSIKGITGDSPLSDKTGRWIYGCDVCQDACPFNKRARTQEEDFPNLESISQYLTPEQILLLSYGEIREKLGAKFWYIKPNEVWKWKTSALNYMKNNFQATYRPYIEKACQDENENVRLMGQRVLGNLSMA